MRLPPALHPGDRVAVFSSSSPVEMEVLERTRRYFQERGHPVTIAPHTLDCFGYMAGLPQVRAGDLNHLLRDPQARMLVTAWGGQSAVQLLPLVDAAALANAPKIICGLSDPSILLLALTVAAGVPTFHGCNGVDFGLAGPTPYSEENFWRVVAGGLGLPHPFPLGQQLETLRGGPPVEGRLWGGHLSTIQPLIGTRWLPQWPGAIFFFEEFQAQLARTDAILAHFRLAGVFERLAGMVVGLPLECEPPQAETYPEIILRNCRGYNFPILYGAPVGHTPDALTLPLGCRVRLDAQQKTLELLEQPVAG